MRNFDLDLIRVTYEHFITGKAAINFPRPHATSGGWHYLAYWNSKVGEAKVSLAGIHYPDTRFCFGDTGILNATDELELRGWKIDRQIYMADHFPRDRGYGSQMGVQPFRVLQCRAVRVVSR